VAAIGTQTTAAGQQVPFSAISANGGKSWSETTLPLPKAGAATVTALTAAGHGFTATGTYGQQGAQDVVVWLLPGSSAPSASWTEVAPQGLGLAGQESQAITALAASGAALTGVGFTATTTTTEPTIWQSPVRD
jgi:hypothetical protein